MLYMYMYLVRNDENDNTYDIQLESLAINSTLDRLGRIVVKYVGLRNTVVAKLGTTSTLLLP